MRWGSVRVQILVLAAMLLSLVAALGLVIYVNFEQERAASERVRHTLDGLLVARMLDEHLDVMQTALGAYVFFGRSDAAEVATGAHDALVVVLGELETRVPDQPTQVARLQRLRAAAGDAWVRTAAPAVEAARAGRPARAQALAGEFYAAIETLRAEANGFVGAEERRLVSQRNVHDAVRQRFRLLLLVGGLAVLGVGATASVLLGRRIARPLTALTQAVERVAAGDLSQQVTVGTGDEVERLGAAFNRMVAEVTRREEAIDRGRREAETVVEVQRDLAETLEPIPLLRKIARHARLLCRSDLAYIAPFDARTGVAQIIALVGERTPALRGLTIEPGRGLGGRVLETLRPHTSANYAEDARLREAYLKPALAEGVVATLAVPMILNQEVMGLIFVANRTPRAFDERDESVLLRLAVPAALAVRNARLVTELAQERDLLEVRSRDLARSEAQVRGIVAAASDAILTVDAGGALTSVNHAAEAMFGFPSRDLIGRELDQLIPPPTPGTDGTPPLGAQTDISRRQELEATRRDGTRFPIELSVSVVRTERDHFFAVVVRDITERKQAEQALLQLAAIVESSDDAILSLALDQAILSWNPGAERILGYSAEDVTGKDVSLVIPRDEVARIRERMERGEPVANYETTCVRKDGLKIDVSLTVSPIRSATGRMTGVSVVARDITERKAIERLKDEFVATVSHELRTPLTAIKGHIELVLDGDAGPVSELQQRFLGIATQNTDRLGALISDLLDVEKIEAGKIELRQEPVDVGAVLREVVATFRLEAERKGLAYRDEIGALPEIVGDRDRLVQVFGNLVANAIKYTPEGEVGVRAAETSGAVEVIVHDTGIGMSRDEQRQLFSKFFRSQDAVVRTAGGTGLGLVIAKGIVDRHGGSIGVESERGAGSRFRILLPVSSEAARPWPRAAAG